MSSAPSTAWKEVVPEGEEAQFLALAELVREVQRRQTAASGGATQRALHVKPHAGARATFTVKDGLPDHARQGLFLTPKRYDAYVRFSNGGFKSQHDKVPDVRGIAIKVVGVPGKKVIPPLADCVTQDFLLIHNAQLPFRSPEEFVKFLDAASKGEALLLFRLIGALGPFRPFGLVRDLLSGPKPAPSAALQRFHSAAPVAFGPFAAKLDLLPENVGHAATPTKPNHYAEDLAARLGAGSLKYTLRAQFFVDEERTPIEDPTKAWSEDESPFVPLAELVLPQQDVLGREGKERAARIETLSFDPWHALVEHRPLGAIMRARNPAYRLSTQERGAAAEPTEVT